MFLTRERRERERVLGIIDNRPVCVYYYNIILVFAEYDTMAL